MSETIAAIATPIGEGALGIVRISGPYSFNIVESIFQAAKKVHDFPSHTVHYGKIVCNKEVIDSVLLVKMDSPHSYTGENTIELTCHGGRLVLHKVLSAIISAGARPAEPGEFTMRAFFNGKIDLAQAEAVQQLISAENELALRAATRNLEGNLSSEIEELRKSLVGILAEVEASIDFNDEDITIAGKNEILSRIASLEKRITSFADTYSDGRKIAEGIHVAIAGKPNVGKSSILNALLEKDRAITTHIPGTTRDVIRESLIWQGILLQIYDTAGIRQSDSIIEKEGIRRSVDTVSHADLVLFILDASKPISSEDSHVAEQIKANESIVVLNKCDLKQEISSNPFGESSIPYCISISALRNTNINTLKDIIIQRVWQNGIPLADNAIITNARHKKALDVAISVLSQARESISSGLSPELTALHLREALDAFGAITGKTVTDEILEAIFSKFCIGK